MKIRAFERAKAAQTAPRLCGNTARGIYLSSRPFARAAPAIRHRLSGQEGQGGGWGEEQDAPPAKRQGLGLAFLDFQGGQRASVTEEFNRTRQGQTGLPIEGNLSFSGASAANQWAASGSG
ncbi:hypothetical protein KM043_018638 [Ampulex compressa]|nr:hypothetical protein KM043_018638 [Ampulex compressa]